MTFIRATPKQIQAIKNLCFDRRNIRCVLKTLDRLEIGSIYRLSIGDASDLISALLPKGNSTNPTNYRNGE